MSKIVGNLSGVLCRVRRGAKKQSGPYVEYTYEGPRDTIYGLLSEVATADDWNIDHDGLKHTLTARFSDAQEAGTPATPVNEVRLHANRVTKSVYNAPAFAGVPPQFIRRIRESIQDPSGPSPGLTVAGIVPGVTFTFESPEVIAGYQLYNLLLDGVEHIVIYQPVLVRSFIASSEYVFTAGYAKVGNILSDATLAEDAAIDPAILKVNLPGGGGTVGGVVFGGEPARPRYHAGWLKHYPEFTQAGGNKGVLTREYEFGLWSEALYGTVV